MLWNINICELAVVACSNIIQLTYYTGNSALFTHYTTNIGMQQFCSNIIQLTYYTVNSALFTHYTTNIGMQQLLFNHYTTDISILEIVSSET